MTLNLSLVPIDEDPNLAAIRAILSRHGILSDQRWLCREFGGAEMHFETSWLGEGASSFYGQIFQAELNLPQCELLFELAVEGNLVLTPELGPPHLLVCGNTHSPEEVHDETAPPWLEEICFLDSARQLHDCLHGEWETFRSTFLDRGTDWGPREQWPKSGQLG